MLSCRINGEPSAIRAGTRQNAITRRMTVRLGMMGDEMRVDESELERLKNRDTRKIEMSEKDCNGIHTTIAAGHRNVIGQRVAKGVSVCTESPIAHRMNGTEQRYANLLDLRIKAGDIHSYKFESIKLRLADRTWYTPDFFIPRGPNQRLPEIHEVKGFARDDWKVKWKVCIEMYPEFRFVLVTYKKGQWNFKYEC
jgi:hypothetical protein